MTRRELFQMLTGAAAAAIADPERLLWTPRRKLISIPTPTRSLESVTVTEMYWIGANGQLYNLRDGKVSPFMYATPFRFLHLAARVIG